jgi:putative SOS response-associated peptidase YedK
MLLGGLWSRWKGELTFTVVTKPANTLMSRVHNAKQRMPVIVSPAEAEKWLAGGGTRELEAFAFPRDDDGLAADEVERPKSPPKSTGPAEPAQGDLFG